MSEPAILFVKPGAVRAGDKRKLSQAGVIVVEIDDPSAVKLVRADPVIEELGHGAILAAAASAIATCEYNAPRTAFGLALAKAIGAAHRAKRP